MGLFKRSAVVNEALTAAVHAPAGTLPGLGFRSLASSTPNSLSTVFLPDILGDETWAIPTRAQAVSIPSVSAGRNLIVGQISRLPLKAKANGEELATQPTWLYRTNGALSPQMRLALTIDDLIFYGWSLWLTTRGADGFITDAARCPIESWRFNDKGQVVVGSGNATLEDGEGILIPGPIPGGFLQTGCRTIRQALDMENTRAQRLRNPIAVTELHRTDDTELEDEEVIAVRDNYAEARRSANGSVVVTPASIEVIDHDGASVEFFTEVANALAVAVAQHLGIPAGTVDAIPSGSGSSFNYSSKSQDHTWWTDTGLSFWAEPITSRLSMDDCVPRGTFVQFDLEPVSPADVMD